jgi:subtilisin family serine protease
VEKDVDILVIATGTHVKAHDGVRAAINTLPDKVIVIAAAGNRDHCERVIFPARMPRVMCTYATTPRNYVLRTLNPNPRTNAYNFGILGIAIQPEGWDTPLTGTSYAAAIAAALAAGLLNFSRQAVRDGERKLNLEGYEKMNVIFEELARDNTDQGYSCIVPWRMLHILEEGTEEEHRRRIREYFADLILQRM